MPDRNSVFPTLIPQEYGNAGDAIPAGAITCFLPCVATAEIWISASGSGRSASAVARVGGSLGKKLRYTVFMSWKWRASLRKTLTTTTRSEEHTSEPQC